MNQLLADAAHALRRFRRAPGFTAVALLTLALGIGANTAIFSIIQSVVLRPLPYTAPERIVMIWDAKGAGETTWLSASEVKGYAEKSRAFDEVAGYTDGAANLTGGRDPLRVLTASVTPNLFRVLGAKPLHGRPFFAEDAIAEPTVAIISHGLWLRRYNADSTIVGQSIVLNDVSRTIIGVMPADFRLPVDFNTDRLIDVIMPQTLSAPNLEGWGNRSFLGIARLRPGVTPAAATAELHATERRWFEAGAFPNATEPPSRKALPMKDYVLGDVRTPMFVLAGAVAFILLIACANVANLMLARADERHREVAIRRALGASRSRIIRQLLTESVLLGLAGGLLGTALAFAGTRALIALSPASIPRVGEVGVDTGVFVFALVLAIGTGVLFGLAPALELARPNPQESIRAGGRTASVGRGQQRLRDSLAVAQMAFCVTLLIGAMLLVKSFGNLRRVDLGFDTESALTFRTALPVTAYNSRQTIAFYRRALDQLAQLPGVRAVGATRILPLTGTIGDWSITIEGRTRAPGENPNGDWQVVTPGYAEAMGMHLVQGRFLANADDMNAPPSAVVNEVMAKRYWPEGNVIGKRFRIGSETRPWITIVGVARQVHHNAVTETERAEMYVPHAQWAAAGASTPRGMTFVLRTTADPFAVIGHVRRTMRELDPNVPLGAVQTLEGIADGALAQPRFATTLVTLFGGIALLLATIGIYGVISLRVTRRGREIGIRMALGARTQTVLAMVLQRGVAIAAVGVAIGTLGALWATQAISGLLYGVGRLDPQTFASVPLFLGAVSLVASLVPALRATRIDPARALRED